MWSGVPPLASGPGGGQNQLVARYVSSSVARDRLKTAYRIRIAGNMGLRKSGDCPICGFLRWRQLWDYNGSSQGARALPTPLYGKEKKGFPKAKPSRLASLANHNRI